MAKLFEEILSEAAAKGIIPSKNATSIEWFRTTAKEIKSGDSSPEKIIKEDAAVLKRTLTVGKMYLFNYFAKHHDDLSYYDQFPLIFPFRKVEDGFYGINMHYLPLPYRARLMDALYTLLEGSISERSRLKINYDILSRVSRQGYYKPCVKHYLNTQLKSRFMEIPATKWDIALFLPLQRFVKASTQKIYRDSLKIIRER
jgi:hypothetical protein